MAMYKLKKSEVFALITCISIAVGYVEARIGVLLEHIDGVKKVIGEGQEALDQFKHLGEQLEELQTEEFFFPLPALPEPCELPALPDSEWMPCIPAPPPPPLEPFPDPIGGSRA